MTVFAMTACGGDAETQGTEVASRATVPPATAPSSSTTTLPAGVPPGEDTTVSRIIDGDTVEVAGGRSVRLIGIDTPETVDPRTPQQCFGAEATAHTKELLPVGTAIRLAYDVERLDRFGRTLAYVYRLTDGLFVNVAIARDGFARQLTVPPNIAHAEEFTRAVSEARASSRGLWTACPPPTTAAPTTRPAPSPTAPPATASSARTAPAPAPAPTRSGNCHPSYTGACVPVASDVDCGGGTGNGPAYVYEEDIRVVGPDEYGLDADNDGIACESR